MKSITEYINENSSEIKTKEIINTLKDGGETSTEIKKEINVNKPTISYIDFVKLFNKKCFEWFESFIKIHKNNQKKEGDDYLVRNLGKDWVKYFNESFKEFHSAIVELDKLLKENINEGLYVKEFDNYKEFYNFLLMLNEFNNKADEYEKNLDSSKYDNILKARLKISDSIKKLFKSTKNLKELLDTIYQYKKLNI